MLGQIYIWKNEVEYTHKVKVRFGDLWFYLLILRKPSITPLEECILWGGKIIKSTCSRREKWKDLREPDFSDYRNLSLHELSRVIFIGAPEDERKEREDEWKSLGSYYRRGLPKKIDLNVYWSPNRFDLEFPCYDLNFDFWKKLSKRKNKRKPRNLIRWFESARRTGDRTNYISQPLGTFEVDLPSLIWWLEDEHGDILLEEMFGNI